MLTIKAAVFRHKIETVVLILPVATMIAFAQLRASMPSAPTGFGKPPIPPTRDDILDAYKTFLLPSIQHRSDNHSEAGRDHFC
jgi:hypothetical protein